MIDLRKINKISKYKLEIRFYAQYILMQILENISYSNSINSQFH